MGSANGGGLDLFKGLNLCLLQETCPSVKNILLLDSEGKRVAVKYYSDDWPTLSAKLAFEKSVFAKTQKANAGTEGNLHLISLIRKGLFSIDGDPWSALLCSLEVVQST